MSFQLHGLQHEILQKSNNLQDIFFINIFPLETLNYERNQWHHYLIDKTIKRQSKQQ